MELTEWLEEHDVEYFTDGKNVSHGWVNIQCPFPGCGDTSNHCGIRLSDLRISCWICGSDHTFVNLAMELTECSYKEAIYTKKSLSRGAGYDPLLTRRQSDTSSNITRLPLEATPDFTKKHLDYLRSRGFIPPKKYIKKYKLLATHPIGKYQFRIIIPVYMNNQLVSFTSRDVTGKQTPPYLSASDKEGKMNIKSTIYNYDNLRPRSNAILVEGALDVWKLGDGTISPFGVKYTDRQIILLKRKEIQTLFIMFDNDSAGRAGGRNFAKVMAPLVKKIEVVTFETINDPGDLSIDEVSVLKYQIGFDIG